ncbi:MAG: hypothetical protein ACP5QO_03030 [Clostridia bacterium]
MEPADLVSYLVLSFFAHTAADVSGNLIPNPDAEKVRMYKDWLSSGFGVLLAFGTGVNLLTDLAIPALWPPAGLLITGILMGQGLRFGTELLAKVPRGSLK